MRSGVRAFPLVPTRQNRHTPRLPMQYIHSRSLASISSKETAALPLQEQEIAVKMRILWPHRQRTPIASSAPSASPLLVVCCPVVVDFSITGIDSDGFVTVRKSFAQSDQFSQNVRRQLYACA